MMMGKSFLLCSSVLATLFFSCKEKQPEGILTEDQMVVALTDFYLKETKINSLALQPDSAAVVMQYYKQKYAAKIGIADSVLDRSYQHYLENSKAMSRIYDRVIDSLSLQQQKSHARGDH